MEENMLVERTAEAVVESERDVVVMNSVNSQNETGRQKDQTDSAREQQIDLDGKEISEAYNLTDMNVARV